MNRRGEQVQAWSAGRRIVSAAPVAQGPRVALPIRWAFYLVAFSLPFDLPDQRIPLDLTTVTAAVLLATTVLDLRSCYGRASVALGGFAVYLFVFVVSFVLNGAEHQTDVAVSFARLVELVLLFWVAYNLLHDATIRKTTLVTFAVACVGRALMQLSGVGVRVSSLDSGAPRVSALGQNPDFIAAILGAGFVVLLGLTYGRDRPLLRPRWLVWPLTALLGVVIMQTGSRGALVALLAGLVVFTLGGASLKIVLRNTLTAILGVGLLAALVASSETMQRRAQKSVGGDMAGRERIYPELLNMFLQKPLLGWGPITNKYELGGRLHEVNRWRDIARREGMSDDPRWVRRDAHNVALEVLTTTGLLGFFPFAAGVTVCLLAAWRARRSEGILPLALAAAVFTFNMSENRLAGKLEWLTLAYTLATGSRVVARQRNNYPGGLWPAAGAASLPSPHKEPPPRMAVR